MRRLGVMLLLIVMVLSVIPVSGIAAAPSIYAQVEALKQQVPVKAPVHFGVAKGKNVIVLQLEALQTYVIDRLIDGQEVTPNLNRLVRDGIYFPNFYDQIGGGNTSDAEMMSVTGVLPISKGAVATSYADKRIPSLLRNLRNLGYVTSTFHADSLSFWNRKKLYPALDWQELYDINYFGKNDVIGYGPSDDILFKKTIEKFKAYKAANKKFFSEVVTLTGHKPYNFLPADHQYLTLPEEYVNTLTGNYLQTQRYVDEQIGMFIAMLKENGLYDDTVLVVYGDHFGIHPSNVDAIEKPLLEAFTGMPYTMNEAFKVPLILKVPSVESATISMVGGQADIMPTVANILGIKLGAAVVFGRDLLNQTTNLVVQPSYYTRAGSFITKDYFFMPGKKGFTDATIYNVETNLLMPKTMAMQKEYERALKLIPLAKTYFDSLPKR